MLSSELLSSENTKLTEQDFNLITQAQDDFNKHSYDKCLETLCQLEQSMGVTYKIQHNKCIAEFYKNSCKNHAELLQMLELESSEKNKLKLRSPIVTYNKAVVYYHKRKYFSAIDILMPLVERLDDLEESIVSNVGVLVISCLLATNQLKRAMAFLDAIQIHLGISLDSVAGEENTSPETLSSIDGFNRMFKMIAMMTNVLNRKTVVIPDDETAEFAALKAHQYYLMKDFQMAAKQLSKKFTLGSYGVETHGEDLDTCIANNMGIIHLRVRHYAVAAKFFQNAITFDNKFSNNLRNVPLHHLSAPRSREILYNLGISMLHLRRPKEAFECFLISLKTYHKNPRLWFRLAEACIMCNEMVKRIKRDGYPVEIHTVQTLDGYILTLHRVPYNGGVRRPVVFLMTGIYASSDAWLLNGRENSLPYLLSNNGYDVWMGNNRGNIYTKKNVKYSPDDREFWNFSWHEMGVYDMPAMVDYILQLTGQKTMHFSGVSQGATIFLVMNAMFPHYNAKFETAHLLAPVAFVNHMKGPLAKVFAPFLGTRNYLSVMLEGVEMVSTNRFFKRLFSMGCLQDENPHTCISRIWPAVGYDTKHLNKTLIPDIMANFPVGGSFKQIMHYFQSYNSGKFRQYDYGSEKNKMFYNQTVPPDYILDRVTVPTFVYFSASDYIVSVRDIQRLVMRLPNVHAVYKVPWEKWNHLDFICGLGVKEYIFDKVVDIINAYTYYREKRKEIMYF